MGPGRSVRGRRCLVDRQVRGEGAVQAAAEAGFDRTKPGAMQFTRMPCAPSSRAVCRVKPMRPAFALAYAWMPVRLYDRPAPDEMFTMAPPRPRFMAGATARVK